MSGFQGFPPELFTFFEGLDKDNSKAYWKANRTTWEKKVRQPMLALLADRRRGTRGAIVVPTFCVGSEPSSSRSMRKGTG